MIEGIIQVTNYLDPYILRSLAFMVGVSTFMGSLIGSAIYRILKNIFNLIFLIKMCPLCDEPKFEEAEPSGLLGKIKTYFQRKPLD